MDEINIRTGFFQGIIVKIIKKVIRQKTGYNPELRFNDPIQVNFDGSKAKVHLNLDIELGKDDLQKILKDLV